MEVQFDPGFVKYLSAFIPSIDYIYGTLAQYKNFNQKKMSFKMYYPKILMIIKMYIGFYLGCMLWAMCIKRYEGADILNNIMCGIYYDENETLSEVDFFKKYLEQLKKDAKYYANIDYTIDETSLKIIDLYREFLKLNKGFTNTKTTDDIKLPENLKIPENLDEVNKNILEVVDNGRIYDLMPFAELVI